MMSAMSKSDTKLDANSYGEPSIKAQETGHPSGYSYDSTSETDSYGDSYGEAGEDSYGDDDQNSYSYGDDDQNSYSYGDEGLGSSHTSGTRLPNPAGHHSSAVNPFVPMILGIFAVCVFYPLWQRRRRVLHFANHLVTTKATFLPPGGVCTWRCVEATYGDGTDNSGGMPHFQPRCAGSSSMFRPTALPIRAPHRIHLPAQP